jgi:hypothetical protein
VSRPPTFNISTVTVQVMDPQTSNGQHQGRLNYRLFDIILGITVPVMTGFFLSALDPVSFDSQTQSWFSNSSTQEPKSLACLFH